MKIIDTSRKRYLEPWEINEILKFLGEHWSDPYERVPTVNQVLKTLGYDDRFEFDEKIWAIKYRRSDETT